MLNATTLYATTTFAGNVTHRRPSVIWRRRSCEEFDERRMAGLEEIMRLFFLRHGIAEPGHSGLSDFDRQLTNEGRAELEDVAHGLRQLKIRPDRLLSSPLVRARQTAEVVAPALAASVEIADELRSGAAFAAFQELVRRY